jgi:hypothetical protein
VRNPKNLFAPGKNRHEHRNNDCGEQSSSSSFSSSSHNVTTAEDLLSPRCNTYCWSAASMDKLTRFTCVHGFIPRRRRRG